MSGSKNDFGREVTAKVFVGCITGGDGGDDDVDGEDRVDDVKMDLAMV